MGTESASGSECGERGVLSGYSTLPLSRPPGQSLPLGERVFVLIHLLCRRSFRCDGSPSLRLFALGLRANKVRLLGPCCLGGSTSRFIDQSRGVLLFVFFFWLSAALLDFIFCFLILIFLFSFASPCGGVLFFAVRLVSRGVSSFLLSSHFLASVLVTCPRCAHRWSARSN